MSTSRKKRTKQAFLPALLSVGLLAALLPSTSMQAAPTYPLITEVYADTNVSYEPDEYIAISNPTSNALSLAGWWVQVGSNKLVFPTGTTLGTNQTLYVTKTATTFRAEMLFAANYEYGSDSDASVPQMTVTGSVPTLANAGSAVHLYNASGALVDTMTYGTGTATSGWSGSSVPTVSGGTIYVRERDELLGTFPDSNTATDWQHLRVYQAGQTRFAAPTYTYAGTLQPYSSPDNSYATLVELINSATSTIDLNVYEFHSTHLLSAIQSAAARGVKVRVFLEGGAVGGLVDQGRYVAQQLTNAGAQVRFLISDTANGIYKRYRFDHAKYAVIDNSRVFAQSENFKSSGVPVNNNYGNRGWGVIVNNAHTAAYFTNVFNADWNVLARDSFPYTASHTTYGAPPSSFVPDTSAPTSTYAGNFINKPITGEFSVTPVIAPDSTFLRNNSILGLANTAQHSLLVEQLYIHKYWGSGSTASVTATPNHYLEAVIAAARRGVKVRVLLDSAFLDASDPRDNQYTVQYINGIAAAEGLDMQAKLIDLPKLRLEKVHNKGMIADGKRVLISSINWSENSPENNREAGLIVQNAEVTAYYEQLFWYDWTAGVQTWNPEEAQGTRPVLISEVMYATGGYDATREYVELYNRNNVAVDLSGYKLVNKSGSFTLPARTVIPAHSFLTVGKDTTAFATYKGFGLDVSNLNLTLTNTGDLLELKNTAGTAVDSVAWNSYLSGWSHATPNGQVLARTTSNTDTDTAADWMVTTPNPKQ